MNCDCFAYSFRAAGLTDIGKRRSSNQDRVFLSPELGLFGVSDGMGGLAAGETAARYVSEAMPVMVSHAAGEPGDLKDPAMAAELLRAAADTVSDCLYESQNRDAVLCGATEVSLWLRGDSAVYSWLGDSRAYLLPKYKKTLRPLTEDMNVAALLVREGLLKKEDAGSHPGASQLIAYVGMPAPAESAAGAVKLSRGDRLLLCSDGLYGMVEEREIARILRSSRSPETVCRRLIEAANAAGGRDNISAVYIIIQ